MISAFCLHIDLHIQGVGFHKIMCQVKYISLNKYICKHFFQYILVRILPVRSHLFWRSIYVCQQMGLDMTEHQILRWLSYAKTFVMVSQILHKKKKQIITGLGSVFLTTKIHNWNRYTSWTAVQILGTIASMLLVLSHGAYGWWDLKSKTWIGGHEVAFLLQ